MLVALVCSAMLTAVGQASTAGASTTVGAVKGSAFGYFADNIVLFGGAQSDTGPDPSVTLASDASNSPQTATATTGLVKYGPATLFSSDQINVSSSGSLGPSGSATSSTDIVNINQAATQPSTGSEIFTADQVTSTCTASPTGTSGSTTITDGTLHTDSGWDDGDLIYPEPLPLLAGGTAEHDPVIVTVPANPAPNTEITGHIHLNGTTMDSWKIVFNEHVTNPDGSVTVNAAHEYFLGPTLTGDLIIGQSVCGVSRPG